MDTMYTQGAITFGDAVRKDGWEPLVCIAMRHGKCYTWHIYACTFAEDKTKERCARFVFSSNPAVVPESVKEFKNIDDGNADYKMVELFASPVPHMRIPYSA